MIQVIVGTNRKGSRSDQLADFVVKSLKEQSVEAEKLSLEDLSWELLEEGLYGVDHVSPSFKAQIAKVDQASGLYVICPEYNGSYPGVLKAFIDYWSYPRSFDHRPVAFMGLGGRFGGLRPVEHLQHVFGYRNAFIFPDRVFLQNVWELISPEGEILDKDVDDRIKRQTLNYSKFVKALEDAGLHANQQGTTK